MEATVAALETFDRPVRLQQAGLELIHSMCSSTTSRVSAESGARCTRARSARLASRRSTVGRGRQCSRQRVLDVGQRLLQQESNSGAGQRAVAAGAIRAL